MADIIWVIAAITEDVFRGIGDITEDEVINITWGVVGIIEIDVTWEIVGVADKDAVVITGECGIIEDVDTTWAIADISKVVNTTW